MELHGSKFEATFREPVHMDSCVDNASVWHVIELDNTLWAIGKGEGSYTLEHPRNPLRQRLRAIFLAEEGCCHDYDDNWKCKLCGYQLPAKLVKRIDEPLKPRKKGEEEEGDEEE